MKEFMRNAIKIAQKGFSKGNSPFGACIVKNGKVVAVAHNTVFEKQDSTNHAEINAIRKACKKLGTFDLSGCAIYSTTEPCPMCFSAIHWARIGAIVYGTTISDVKKLGFSELTISCQMMKKQGKSKVKIKGDYMRAECVDLLKEWKRKLGKTY
ncbi:MAG: nucleoside deaminase [Candidatus Micrarchaeota archaeon]